MDILLYNAVWEICIVQQDPSKHLDAEKALIEYTVDQQPLRQTTEIALGPWFATGLSSVIIFHKHSNSLI